MLRTNLSTRPFYNDRIVKVLIGLGVVLTGLLTAFNVAQIVSLNTRNRELVVEIEQAGAKAQELRRRAQAVRQSLRREDLEAVQREAQEANLLIERRTFSWTDLFNRFEETLPADVRIVAVTPQVDRLGRMLVAVSVASRRAENILLFIDRLEATGAFRDLLPRQQEVADDGTVTSVLQGYYDQAGFAATAVAPAAASESDGAGSNASPQVPPPPAPRAEAGR